jgi:excisionase family DNA binding protein
LTPGPETKHSNSGEAENPTTAERKMIMEKLLLSPTEAAAHLSVGRSKIYELIRLGQLRSVKVGGCRRIPQSALAEFVSGLEAVG